MIKKFWFLFHFFILGFVVFIMLLDWCVLIGWRAGSSQENLAELILQIITYFFKFILVFILSSFVMPQRFFGIGMVIRLSRMCFITKQQKEVNGLECVGGGEKHLLQPDQGVNDNSDNDNCLPWETGIQILLAYS